ncbi:MAG: anti-sigma factor [Pyrinomonadaceae bacterium]|nr:anti-sigma factor [Pyrinomonadaceae bacterium]
MEESILDLLCKEAVYGLTEEEQQELAKLEQSANSGMDSQAFEYTAAALSVAGLGEIEPMPEHLHARISADLTRRMSDTPVRSEVPRVVQASGSQTTDEARGSIWNWMGWAVAAAACIALAFNIFSTREARQISGGPTPSPTVEKKPSIAELREQLLASGADIRRATWGKGNVAGIEEISGDVVWSDTKQEGYMRFRGLPKNDPSKETYQLWIFEDGKLEPHPKDGGVFDVTADGEVIVPIDAKLAAKDPKVFAITIEKPGGVVVSGREKIAALAKTETAIS